MSQIHETPTTATNDSKGSTQKAKPKFSDNSAASQRTRLLEALRVEPVSTLKARRELDIMHPSARVQELKEHGYNIITRRIKEESQPGCFHRVAYYVLLV